MKKSMIFSIIIIISISFLCAADWDLISKIVASDRGHDDYFSTAIAISGNYAIVGAYRENQSIDEGGFLEDAGSAYIFRFNGSEWVEMQKLVAPTRAAEDLYGFSVDICGNYAIVGSHQENVDGMPGCGAAYIYYFDGSSWVEQDKLMTTDRDVGDHFGYSVALTEDKAVIGAVYEDDDKFGADSIASAGSAYVFSRSGSNWFQQSKLLPNHRAEDNRFGYHVAISGSYVLVTSPYEDLDADSLDVEVQAGAAYVFHNAGGSWSLQQKLVASDRDLGDYFGYRADIDGSTIVVGAYMEDHDADGLNRKEKAGSAYIFNNIGSVWSETQKIVASERWASDFFGCDLSLEDDLLIVGARGEDHDTDADNYIENAGAAYIFKIIGGSWTEQDKIIETNRRADDAFGSDVAMSGDVVLVSAPGNDLDADELNLITSAGAAYVFSTGIGGIVEPEISVYADSIEIVSGDDTPSLEDHTDFGPVSVGSEKTYTYSIENKGSGYLYIDTVTVSDSWGEVFGVITQAPDSIAPGASGDFSISYSPTDTLTRVTSVHIGNNDDDENPYVFDIRGQGKFPYSGGSGTEIDPYRIASYEDLLELSATPRDWIKFFVQTADIDAAATDSLNIGDYDGDPGTPDAAMGFSPIGDSPTEGERQMVAFSGSYDGANHTVSNLMIHRPEENFVGFFGYIKDTGHSGKTAVKNVNLENVFINGDFYIGGLVGWNLDAAIDSCTVSGTINTLNGTAGGLVGFDQDNINFCHTECSVTAHVAGGLVGYKEFGRIMNSSAHDTVFSISADAGGLVGSVYQADISNSYSDGDVTGFSFTGGFAGRITHRTTIRNCYAKGEVNGQIDGMFSSTAGFCGLVDGFGINLGSTISDCYSLTSVHYGGTPDPTDKGFVGTVTQTNEFENNFFDVTSSGQLSDGVATATGKDSLAFRDLATFTDTVTEGLTEAWDFAYHFNDDAGDDDIWDMDTSGIVNNGYPFLFWENGDEVSLQEEEVGVDNQKDIVREFKLLPAYPNPFNPSTAISYLLSSACNVDIKIFDMNGKQISTLYHGNREAGRYELTWNANDMPSGVYIVRMIAGKFTASQKIVLIK